MNVENGLLVGKHSKNYSPQIGEFVSLVVENQEVVFNKIDGYCQSPMGIISFVDMDGKCHINFSRSVLETSFYDVDCNFAINAMLCVYNGKLTLNRLNSTTYPSVAMVIEPPPTNNNLLKILWF